MSFLRNLFISGIMCLAVASGCATGDESNVPADFTFLLDVRSAGDGVAHNVNIRINAEGSGRYERYDTGSAIRGDENGMVTYSADQVVARGDFQVSGDALDQLWAAIEENNIFELTEDYRMAIGHSYAFIMVQANDRRHQVFNIGMEVPEIRAIVEATRRMLPEGVDIEYGEGFVP